MKDFALKFSLYEHLLFMHHAGVEGIGLRNLSFLISAHFCCL